MAEGCIESLHLDFLECKKKEATLFPGLDLKDIIESNDEDEDEEGAEGAEAGTEPVGIAAPEAVAKEKAVMEEAIIEAVVSADAMIAEAAEDSGAIQIDALVTLYSFLLFVIGPRSKFCDGA